jgi:uncharacterized protein YvpB
MKLPLLIKLDVPFKNQRNNLNNPDGSCSTTCLAMCLEYFSIPRKWQVNQFEDEIYQMAIDTGANRHSPYGLVKLAEMYGIIDHFTEKGTIEQTKQALASGSPVITHGYFTKSGHLVVLVGYDETGFFVHDPYGEWFHWGYERNPTVGETGRGRFIHYSYKLIEEICIPDGNFWIHIFSKSGGFSRDQL